MFCYTDYNILKYDSWSIKQTISKKRNGIHLHLHTHMSKQKIRQYLLIEDDHIYILTGDFNCLELNRITYQIQDGFIAFSCIQLYTYKTLFTKRHAQYLGSLLIMIYI